MDPRVVAGVDLAASPKNPTAVCILEGRTFRDLVAAHTDEGIVRALREAGAEVAAVDAPLTPPDGRAGTYAYREAERAVRAAGIPLHAPSFLGALTFRGMALSKRGDLSCAMIETYPYGVLVRLGYAPRGKKGEPREHARRGAFLARFAEDLPELATHHEVDAVACALAAALHAGGRTEAFGHPGEGRIHLPISP